MAARSVLRVSFDPAANASYVSLQPRDTIQPSAAVTVPVNADINLDFDDEGRLIGVEVLDATRRLHPALLREAESA